MVIAVVGSGGKTSLIKNMTSNYLSQGKKVFVTTTTHMYLEKDTLVSDDAKEIIKILDTTGYVMAGTPDGQKITSLCADTYNKVCAHADIVLVEADGSKHMPLKFPKEGEPVIPNNTDEIIIVTGIHGLGRPASKVCHRLDYVKKYLQIEDNTLISAEHILTLLEQGYLIPLKKQYPYTPITIHPAHDGSKLQRDTAAWILEQLNYHQQ